MMDVLDYCCFNGMSCGSCLAAHQAYKNLLASWCEPATKYSTTTAVPAPVPNGQNIPNRQDLQLHKKRGIRLCVHTDAVGKLTCRKIASYGLRGATRIHCGEHKQPGEISFVYPCEGLTDGVQCQSNASSGYRNGKKTRCAKHKLPGMKTIW